MMSGNVENKPEKENLAYSGVRVVDLSGAIAGPVATMFGADFGMKVTKVEPAEGDMSRYLPPFVGKNSLYYASANRNKESLILDYAQARGYEVLQRLIRKADIVLVNNPSKASMEKHGLDIESLRKIKPDIILVNVSLEGQTSSNAGRKGYDMIAQAELGAMPITGPKDGNHPYRFPGPFVDVMTAMNTFTAMLVALRIRDKMPTPEAQYIDINLYNSAALVLFPQLMEWASLGIDPPNEGDGYRYIEPYRVFETRDSWMVIAIGTSANWKAFCHTIGKEDLLNDPRFKTNQDRVKHSSQLSEILQNILIKERTAHWETIFGERNIPAARVRSIPEFLDDPRTKARNTMVTLTNKEGETAVVVNNPLASSNLPMVPNPSFPPTPGENTEDIMVDLGYSAGEIAALKKSGIIA
jgi:crotonobetainyl-CoA:carnitine CoA-transferase CaiB-like acyl-CoA transferase